MEQKHLSCNGSFPSLGRCFLTIEKFRGSAYFWLHNLSLFKYAQIWQGNDSIKTYCIRYFSKKFETHVFQTFSIYRLIVFLHEWVRKNLKGIEDYVHRAEIEWSRKNHT